jgi:predicted ATP-grasp superfamily ATP-dependent carboligase
MKKLAVVFSGYNQRAVVAFLRTLEANGAEYAIVASSADDPIFVTKYSGKVLATRQRKELDIEDLTDNIKEVKSKTGLDKCVIAPSTEALNRFLLKNRKSLEDIDCEIPLVDKEIYERISDKYSFNKICLQHNIVVPAEYGSPEAVKIPYVAKPKQYFAKDSSTHSPVLVLGDEDHRNFLENYDLEDFYYQEYVEGDSFYLLYYFYKDGSVAKLSQQNFMQQPQGKSIIAAESINFHKTEESLKYEKLFCSLGFNGLVMVEVKHINRKYYMIEANPRFWGPSQLFVDAGVNLFEDFLFDNGLIRTPPSHKLLIKEIKYFWGSGLHETIKDGGKISYHSYSEEEFTKNISEWEKADVYNRKDTVRVYEQEMSA